MFFCLSRITLNLFIEQVWETISLAKRSAGHLVKAMRHRPQKRFPAIFIFLGVTCKWQLVAEESCQYHTSYVFFFRTSTWRHRVLMHNGVARYLHSTINPAGSGIDTTCTRAVGQLLFLWCWTPTIHEPYPRVGKHPAEMGSTSWQMQLDITFGVLGEGFCCMRPWDIYIYMIYGRGYTVYPICKLHLGSPVPPL